MQVTIGQIVRIECEARGVPTPKIVWRLNWGHVGKPPRVTQSSENGKGVLTIRDANENDQGAYSCEAINNKGTIIATPDTILVVKRKSSSIQIIIYYLLLLFDHITKFCLISVLTAPTGICKPPYFNSEARSFDDCLQCFCFALGDTCYSSQLYQSEVCQILCYILLYRSDIPLVNVETCHNNALFIF